MGRVQGKVAIVTGAAQGIGAAYAKALAAEGAKVVTADILPIEAVVAAIAQAGGDALGLRADVADPASVDGMVAATVARFGSVDILVNNAAIFASLQLKPFAEISETEWSAVMNVNVAGMFRCCRAVAPEMRRRQSGKIINISSGTVFAGAQAMLHYVTSKAAVVGLTRSLARELGADNICVNALAPGFTSSEGVVANADFAQPVRDAVASWRCFAREQQPEDLIGPLLFLASSDSDFVTGQTLLVDGGQYTH